MTFFAHVDPSDPNIDLDVHPSPSALWCRVAVVGLWSDSKRTRKAWPGASVVGPLRTMRGIDLLVRNLLRNPQIRVVVVDGPDLRPDVTRALREVFDTGRDPITGEETDIDRLPDHLATSLFATEKPLYRPHPGDPLFEAVCLMLRGVRLLSKEEFVLADVPDEDRAGGASYLPAPKPPPLEVLPHGDPGQRVAGDTLAEVWPRALEQAMRFGRKAMTQYGETREILVLTSVIRDPKRTLDGFTSTIRYTTDELGVPLAALHSPNNVVHGPKQFCIQCEPENALASLKKDLEDRTLLLVRGFVKAWNEEPAREPNFHEESGRSADYVKIREDKIDGFPRAEVHAYPGGLELRPDGYDEEFTRAYGYLDGDTQFGAEVRRILAEAGIRRFDGTFFWDRTVRGGVVLLADAALLDEITRRRLGLFAAAMEQKYGAPLASG